MVINKSKIKNILINVIKNKTININENSNLYLIFNTLKKIEITINYAKKTNNILYIILKRGSTINQNIKINDGAFLKIKKINYSGLNINYVQNYHLKTNAKLEMFGLSFGINNSKEINQIQIDHGEKTKSDIIIRNIINDGYIETNCIGVVPYSSNFCDVEQNIKSFLLKKTSKAINRPILNIDNKNVNAKHGSAIGKINELFLYYLCSRGLTTKECIKIICLSYFKKFSSDIKDKKLLKQIKTEILNLNFIKY